MRKVKSEKIAGSAQSRKLEGDMEKKRHLSRFFCRKMSEFGEMRRVIYKEGEYKYKVSAADMPKD